MIIIDTGPLVALFDRDDQYHKTCKKTFLSISEPLITTWPILTEVMYLLNFSSLAQELCFEFIVSGGLDISSENSKHINRIYQLMKKYNDLPIDFADASLVALAEERNITTVFTLDRKHFRIYKPKHRKAFNLLPK
ncbi:MAG: nucleic-acid-binding protein contains PIN domain protein [Candidatus Scalindua rubra]|uniref:Ribonuclease VapC n=1 Tax=Candidatus Scalindua rubra TaxID=1872076 RepID=A0A1E3X9P6_9BACT|nr:MAG: nucleic-acid-binding protein contains PIN domain protein [Candidatus Scalindua rubra]